MDLIVDWSLKGQDVDVRKVATITHTSEAYVKQLYRAGALGPAPNVAAIVTSLPLYHVTALFVLLEATKQGVPIESIMKVLQTVAGAAYVKLQLSEVAAGRCIQRGGTPALNPQLWAFLHKPGAYAALEQKLPGGPTRTQRYACFRRTETYACDSLEEVSGAPATFRIVDAHAIPALMKGSLIGTLFATQIE